MPDPYDPDAARRALDEASPSTDLWAEAERRAADGSVVTLATGRSGVRRPGRWLAAAAVAALAVGTVAVITSGDDQSVDMRPSVEGGRATGPVCGFDSPVVVSEGPAPQLVEPERTDTAQIYHASWSSPGAFDPQPFELAVPSDRRADIAEGDAGEVQLQRGVATLRTTPSFTQIRWEPEGAEPCETFSVTVAGRPSEASRQAAVDIADLVGLTGEITDGSLPSSVSSASDCSIAIGGDPIALLAGPADPPIVDPGGQPSDQLVSHVNLGSQVMELHVPGYVVNDLTGERVEDVELGRGTAQIWFAGDFVQVRSFPGGDDPCDSFTVTVSGGDDDANRHSAVDLADDIILSSELDAALDGPSLRGTSWQLERSTIDGEPTDGGGLTFRFRQNDVSWTDGCNTFNGSFRQDYADELVVGLGDATIGATCPPNPTSEAVGAVMAADHLIDVRYEGDRLVLTAGVSELVLRPDDG